MPKITAIQTIRTRANGTWLFVKVITDQPGLYGIGSASDHYRCKVVQAAIENIAPLLIGRDASRIEDIWQSVYTSGYWRNDSVINTVQAGIDMALWDIKGKEAGMPVYHLLGGPVPQRRAGLRPCRRQHLAGTGRRCAPLHGRGLSRHPLPARPLWRRRLPRSRQDAGLPEKPLAAGSAPSTTKPIWRTSPRCSPICATSSALGPKFTHDVHEHLHPHNAVHLAKLLEPYRLFFLEDLLVAGAGAAGIGWCASNASRRRPWASCSSTRMNICR